jgi:heme-degrading monooxygenase HmoA
MEKVITRIWHGTTLADHADAYLKFLLSKGTKDYESTPGNLSIHVWRSFEDNKAHFYTVTTWDSFESIKKFAGEDVEKAFYYPEDKNFLLEFEPQVKHHETYVVR